ncbi:MAG: hypothetical protein RIC95_12610 [Vicingaceae bacterium]
MNKEEKETKLADSPPFFKQWKGLYLFILAVEIVLILFFIWITNTYHL